jgi:peptide deformylase
MTELNNTPTNSGLDDYHLKGELLEIFTYPSQVLKTKALEVSTFDDELKSLCHNMLYTMYKAPGIGLAAPQVGVSKRIFVIDTEFSREKVLTSEGNEEFQLNNLKPLVFINPILKNNQGSVIHQEGCLSFPGLYENVKRSESLVVEYQDINGNKNELEVSGLLSICIQHENDHLDGIVFLDRLSLLKKNMLSKKFLKKKKKNNG